MRRISLEDALSGMRLAKTVFTSDGRVLLTTGMEFNDNYRERLRNNGVNDIFVDDDISKGIEIPDVILEETRQDANKLIKEIMSNETLEIALNTEHIKEVINNIIQQIFSNDEIIVNLSEIRSVDDYTFNHSVNVCILSLIIGVGLKFNINRLKDLGVGALLHDVGKIGVPQEILKKPSQLTASEFDQIKKHTIYGYEILKDTKNISKISAFIAMGHHERYDGSGYPMQIKGENIHECARIVAVADVYDALTSDRVYKKKLKPHEVVEYICSLGAQHFDKVIVNEFVKYISLYPVGTGVILNTKEKCLVTKVRKPFISKPVVRVIYDSRGNRVINFYEIDLSRKPDLFIADTCEF